MLHRVSDKIFFKREATFLSYFFKIILQIRETSVSLQSFRGVAQLASASALGAEGPLFESQYPDRRKRGCPVWTASLYNVALLSPLSFYQLIRYYDLG